MRHERTAIEFFPMGDSVVSTIHRILPDGRETADILNVAPVVELSLVPDTPQQKGEFIPYK
jgi:hypothetical protein